MTTRINWNTRRWTHPREVGQEVSRLDARILRLTERVAALPPPSESVQSSFFVYNVKDYGARGDGATNDLEALKKVVALITAAGGGTMYFPAGTYIVSDAWLIASCPNLTIFGQGMGVSIVSQTTDNKNTLRLNSCDNLSIHDITFYNRGASVTPAAWLSAGSPEADALKVASSDYVTIQNVELAYAIVVGLEVNSCNNVRIVNCYAHHTSVFNGFGVLLGDNYVIQGNIAHNNAGQGIEVRGINGLQVVGNTCYSNGGYDQQAGITIEAEDTDVHTENFTVASNTSYDNTGDGIYIASGTNLAFVRNGSVTGNVVRNNTGNGIRMVTAVANQDSRTTRNIVVSGNEVSDNDQDGILMYFCLSIGVSGNHLHGNGRYGINLQSGLAYNRITDNTVADSGASGIYGIAEKYTTVSRNSVKNSGQTAKVVNVAGATNATPIVITSTAHGIPNGTRVRVANVGGNTAANGTWTVANATADTFELLGSVGNGSYSSGGTATVLYAGIQMNSTGTTNNDISGNFIFDDQDTPTQQYGIVARLSSSCTIDNNHIVGSGTAATDALQTDNRFNDNVIFDGDLLHPFPLPMKAPLRYVIGNGTNQSMYISDANPLDHGTGDFSRLAVVRLASYAPAAAVTIAHKADGAAFTGWIWTLETDGKQKLAIGNGSDFTTYVYTSTQAVRCSTLNPLSSLGFAATRNGNVVFFSDGAIDSEVDMSGSSAQSVDNTANERSWQNIDGATEYAFEEYAYIAFNRAVTEADSWQKYFDGFLRYNDTGASSTEIHSDSNAASVASEANATTGWAFARAAGASVANPRTGSAGSYSIRATCDDVSDPGNPNFLSYYTFSRTAGKVYRVVFWGRAGAATTGTVGFRTLVGVVDSNIETINLTTDWVRYSIELTPFGDSGYVGVFSNDSIIGRWFEIDDVQINQVGVVAMYPNDSINVGAWYDVSGNSLTRTYDGATAGNILPTFATGTLNTVTTVTTTPYTVQATDSTVLVDASGGARTVNLPTAVGIKGQIFIIKKIDSTANIVTIDASGSQTIDGNLTYTLLGLHGVIRIQSDGSNWVAV